MIEEDDGEFFADEFLEFDVDAATLAGVESLAPVFQELVCPGVIETG